MSAEDTLREDLEALRELNRSRFDYVLARSQNDTIDATIKAIGKSSYWFYSFSKEERDHLEELADKLHRTHALQAWYVLEEAALDAAKKKVEGLTNPLDWIQQQAATEILNRVVGSKPEKKEISVTNKVTLIWDWDQPKST